MDVDIVVNMLANLCINRDDAKIHSKVAKKINLLLTQEILISNKLVFQLILIEIMPTPPLNPKP